MPEQAEVSNAMNAQITEDTQTEIDLMGLIFRLLDKWYFIALSAVLCAMIAAAYSWFIVTPIYEANTKIYVTNTEDSLIKLADLQIGNYLTNDYKEVFNVWEIHQKVQQNLGLKYTPEQLSNMLTVTNPTETRILVLTVRSTVPEHAALIANEYASVAKEYIAKTMATEGPNIMSLATVPQNPVSPQKARNVILGFLVGAVIACGVITLLFVLDDKIRTSDDIFKISGLPTLAVIPITDAVSNDGRQKRGGKPEKGHY